MSKFVPVLGFTGGVLQGVRLGESGKELVREVAESWPLAAPEVPVPDEGAAPAEDAAPAGAASAADPFVEALRAAVKRFGTHEFALALPLSEFVAQTVRLAPENRDTLPDEAAKALAAITPFPDEPLTPGIETMIESDAVVVAFAAALPEASSLDLADALAAAKVRVVRTDVTALGWLRMLWPRLTAPDAEGVPPPARRLVLMNLGDGWDLAVVDDGAPTHLRGLGDFATAAEFGREVMLSLLQMERPDGADIAEVVVFSTAEAPADVVARLKLFGPVRLERVEDAFDGVEGCAQRLADSSATLDATPASWVQIRKETRYKHRLAAAVGTAVGVWLLAMGVLFGVPFGYDWARDMEKAKCRRHAAAYKRVSDMKAKVKLVQRYSDHARGALEMLKAISDRLPEGITLTSFQYKRDEGVRVTGEAEQPTDAYAFKEKIEAIELDDAPVFPDVRMPSVAGRGGKNKFDLNASFVAAEEGRK